MKKTDTKSGWLADDDFRAVIKGAPLIGIDLIIRSPQGAVWLGQRNFAPARHFWFVPGGRMRKGETLDEAFARICLAELGVAKKRSDARFYGLFEHFYPDNRFEEPGYGTHYVVLAHELDFAEELSADADEHHDAKAWWTEENILGSETVHKFTKAYFQRKNEFGADSRLV